MLKAAYLYRSVTFFSVQKVLRIISDRTARCN